MYVNMLGHMNDDDFERGVGIPMKPPEKIYNRDIVIISLFHSISNAHAIMYGPSTGHLQHGHQLVQDGGELGRSPRGVCVKV